MKFYGNVLPWSEWSVSNISLLISHLSHYCVVSNLNSYRSVNKKTPVSSNINEGIKAVLFFKRKDFTRTKSTKTHISEQKQKRQHFYALKKHLRGRKSLIRLFAFLCFLCVFCAFCAFLCVKQRRQHFYTHKNI